MKTSNREQFKVSSKSNPNSIAGAVVAVLDKGVDAVQISVVGAGAMNQSIKAVAIARGFVAARGVDLICQPSFNNYVDDNNTERTSMVLTIKKIQL